MVFGMLRRGDPVLHDLLELVGGHARVRGHDDLEHRLLPAGQRGFQVALEQRGERLLVLPLRMLRRERLHPVEREDQLEIHRLLGPERAVVVERGDALGGRHELRAAFFRGCLDELDDSFLCRAVVPRRQRICLGIHLGESKRNKNATTIIPFMIMRFIGILLSWDFSSSAEALANET